MKILDQLRSRLGEVREEMRAIAETDAELLTEAQETRFVELEVELVDPADETRGLLADIEREEKREALRSRVEAAVARGGVVGEAGEDRGVPNVNIKSDVHDLSGIPAYGPTRSRELRSRALSAIEDSQRFLDDSHKERASQIVSRNGHQEHLAEFVLLGSSEEYADGFLRSLTDPDSMSSEERASLGRRRELARAMALSDVTGVLVPTHLDTQLILANDGRSNPFRQVCRVETGVTNVYQSVRTAGVTHDWTAEATEVGDNAPSFSNPTATAYKGTVFVPISFEAFEDARGRENDIMGAIADAIDEAESTVFVSGNGTTRPRGLITALDANTVAEVANATSNVLALADVYNVYEKLGARYRNDSTVWFANLAIINDIRQFGTDNYNTQTVQLGARTVPAVLGHPILEASKMDAAVTVAALNNVLAVGDPSTYLIYDRLGTSVEFVPNLFGTTNGRPTGQRGWLAHHRTGANLTVGHAANTVAGFRLLQTKTN